MHEDEATALFDERAHVLAYCIVRGDWRTNRNATVLGDFRRDEPDAPNVDITMLFREPELGREVRTNDVSIQQRDGTPTHFEKLDQHNICNGRFSGTGEAGKKHGEALTVTRRMTLL